LENVLFIFAGIPVYSYGFMLGLGLIFGSLLACREGRRRGLDQNLVFNWFVQVTVVFLVVGRVAFVFSLHRWRMFTYPWVLLTGFQVDEVAGIIGAVIYGTYLLFHSFPRPMAFLDSLAPSVALIQSLANLGSNVFGRQTNVPWAVRLGYFTLHPTPLYAAIVYYLIFAVLWRFRRQTRFDGQLIIGFVTLSSASQWFLLRYREMSAVSWNPLLYLLPAIAFGALWVWLYVQAPLLPLSKRRGQGPLLSWLLSIFGVALTMTLVFFWRFG
jgi:phosphatidylglycerol:prolipoprotein diacylglycerol transferase